MQTWCRPSRSWEQGHAWCVTPPPHPPTPPSPHRTPTPPPAAWASTTRRWWPSSARTAWAAATPTALALTAPGPTVRAVACRRTQELRHPAAAAAQYHRSLHHAPADPPALPTPPTPTPPHPPTHPAAPTTFSNLYFKELTENKWHKKKWNGPLQAGGCDTPLAPCLAARGGPCWPASPGLPPMLEPHPPSPLTPPSRSSRTRAGS